MLSKGLRLVRNPLGYIGAGSWFVRENREDMHAVSPSRLAGPCYDLHPAVIASPRPASAFWSGKGVVPACAGENRRRYICSEQANGLKLYQFLILFLHL